MAGGMLLENGDRYLLEDNSGGYALDGATPAGSTITGTIAPTLPGMTAAATGSIIDLGIVAAALAALASSSTGAVTSNGPIAAALPPLGVSAVGAVAAANGAAINATLPAIGSLATGRIGSSGPTAAALPQLNVAIAGTVAGANGGAITAALPLLSLGLAGGITVPGNIVATLSPLAVSMPGSTSPAAVLGTVAATLPRFTAASAGTTTGTPVDQHDHDFTGLLGPRRWAGAIVVPPRLPQDTDELFPFAALVDGQAYLADVATCITAYGTRPTSWEAAVVLDGSTHFRVAGLTPGTYEVSYRATRQDEHAVVYLGVFVIY